jgi:hypothetical protein
MALVHWMIDLVYSKIKGGARWSIPKHSTWCIRRLPVHVIIWTALHHYIFFNIEKRFQLSLQISYGLIITKLQTPRKYQSRPIASILQELATYSIVKSPFMIGKNLHANYLHLLICHSKRLLILVMSLHWSPKPKPMCALERNL